MNINYKKKLASTLTTNDESIIVNFIKESPNGTRTDYFYSFKVVSPHISNGGNIELYLANQFKDIDGWRWSNSPKHLEDFLYDCACILAKKNASINNFKTVCRDISGYIIRDSDNTTQDFIYDALKL